ncbi:MAG: electron transfer flavoprotein subunit beta/FixA family protein [Rhodanobacteraceae bacterium]|nr:electron transfer flavoprotein subunit beta/FixA family protein [Rhodanobacteraceae bacterium]
MKIIVCIKRVPGISEADIKLAAGSMNVDLGRLPMDVNEADNCAIEEAIRMKEAHGGSVHTVTIGSGEDDVMIRMALAKGCDASTRIDSPELPAHTSPLAIAKVLATAIREMEFDLVLTGAMAADTGNMAVGVALAAELGVHHAAVVRKLDLAGDQIRVVRELEGGAGEVLNMRLPALLTIQTGINKPRYAPILGIRAAQKKELKVLSLAQLGLDPGELAGPESTVQFEGFHFPAVVNKAEQIEGNLDMKSELLAARIVQWGVL